MYVYRNVYLATYWVCGIEYRVGGGANVLSIMDGANFKGYVHAQEFHLHALTGAPRRPFRAHSNTASPNR